MNDPTTPLSADVVDELLSAELDGEFDDAARDAGMTPVEARARLDVTPGTGARREDLARARGIAAAEVAPLDDDVRARLIARAVAAATSDELGDRRARRRVLVVRSLGAAAAAALLVVGAVAVISSNDSDRDHAATANAPLATEDATSGDDSGGVAADEQAEAGAPGAVSFDAVDDAEALRVQVEERLESPQEYADGDSAGADTTIAATESEGRAQASPGASDQATLSAPPGSDTCVTKQAGAYGVAPVPALRGPTTYAGIPASVFVFAEDDNYLIVVAADADCSVLVTQYLHPEP